MTDAPVPLPPPEAVVIKRARQARRLTPEHAAPLTGKIGARRWRQLESGWDGSKPAFAEDDVLAHMAAAVGAIPEQLEGAGRDEAAEVLREILRQRAAGDPGGASAARQVILSRPNMTERDKGIALTVFEALEAAREAADAGDSPHPASG